ncbi:MAG TPA: DUF3224 domain-containing protein [Kofleriaceae bacterium]|nr:DUF3224 domain-containing protein [Kofleriaceae bacterium]
MTSTTIRGEFEVALAPLPLNHNNGPMLSRRALDKTFRGALDATSTGEMLAAGTAVANSAGYVAIERVVGTLEGRIGSFVLQHSSTMNRGVPTQSVTVVPDSGTDALVGLTGSMTIDRADGKHFYNFTYSLPAA